MGKSFAAVLLAAVCLASYAGVLRTKPGLEATYFKSHELTREALSRIDAAIDFDWGTKGMEAGVQGFSARWPSRAHLRPRIRKGPRAPEGGDSLVAAYAHVPWGESPLSGAPHGCSPAPRAPKGRPGLRAGRPHSGAEGAEAPSLGDLWAEVSPVGEGE